jgi:1,4-alpha-glucan branching enzyme
MFLGRQGPTRGVAELEASPQVLHVRLVVPLPAADSVAVVGDFTSWKNGIPLQRAQDGLWVGDLEVPAGRYRYVLVVDGEHIQPDPAAQQVVDDGFGGKNSVLDLGI